MTVPICIRFRGGLLRYAFTPYLLAICAMALASVRAEAKELHFAALDIPPYAIHEANGEMHGVLIDLIRAYRAHSDRNIRVAAFPAARLRKYVLQGEVDCTIYIRTPAAEEVAEAVVYLGLDFKTAVFAKKTTRLTKYEDLWNLRLAVARQTSFGHKIDSDDKITKIVTRDYRQSALMLSRGRVDAILGIDWSMIHNLKEVGVAPEDIGEPLVLNSKPLWLFCSRNAGLTTADKSALRREFVELRRSGLIDRIVSQYQR